MKACGSILTAVFMILLFVNVFLFFVHHRPGKQQQSTYEHRRPGQQQQQQQCEFRRRPEQQQQQLRRPVPSQSIGRSTAGYAIVGYLESVTQGMVPLYARPSPTHRHRFNYYTRNSNEYLIRLPIVKDGRDCTNNLGCDELYDKDVVHVPGIPDSLTVHMYSKEF